MTTLLQPNELCPNDPHLSWAGAISLQESDAWTMPWRLPYAQRDLFPPVELQARTAMAAGVRLTFVSNTRTVTGAIEPFPELSPIDLCCDGKFIGSVPLDGQDRFYFADLPAGEKVIELWLPQFGEFRLKSLTLDTGATVSAYTDTRPRWITYGSSITQCRTAASPTQTWPALVAQARNFNLTCLGFGGQCHLDPMLARLIRDLPADYLSICVGINIYGAASLSPRTFRPAIIGFVQLVREKHPDTPFAVLSPIVSPPRETTPNAVGFTLAAMREEVAAAVAALQAAGDRHLHYVNGLEIFGASYAHLLPDDLHPDAEGYRVMGRHFTEKVANQFFG
ncbi:MAG: SGNH/GDSL hydrolase family protein [Caldilineaceae bacterium]